VAIVVALTGLAIVLAFAFAFRLDSGTAAGLAAGSLTQSSVIGTASGALAQLDLPDDVVRQQQANIAAGYAVTYILGYILTLMFVPFAAPWLMEVDLKKEAAKLEAELSGGKPSKAGNLGYRKFKARAYRVTVAAGQTSAKSKTASVTVSSSNALSAMAATSIQQDQRFSKPATRLYSPDLDRPSSGLVPRLVLKSSLPS
jgi:uncharacterized transporter YbjL